MPDCAAETITVAATNMLLPLDNLHIQCYLRCLYMAQCICDGLWQPLLMLSCAPAGVVAELCTAQVASEDTALSAVRTYVNSARSSVRQAARAALGPLIRCQHLSVYWLSACVLSEHGLGLLFTPFSKQLKKLLMARLADPSFEPTHEHTADSMEGAPASWLLGQRMQRAVSSVQLAWAVSVSNIRALAQLCAEEREASDFDCSRMSAPLDGMMWGLQLQAKWEESGGVLVGLFVVPKNAPADVWYKFKAEITLAGHPQLAATSHTLNLGFALGHKQGWGLQDCFGTGAMAGGWDEAAWAAAGMPSEGDLTITMRVTATHNTPGARFISDLDPWDLDSESPEGWISTAAVRL